MGGRGLISASAVPTKAGAGSLIHVRNDHCACCAYSGHD